MARRLSFLDFSRTTVPESYSILHPLARLGLDLDLRGTMLQRVLYGMYISPPHSQLTDTDNGCQVTKALAGEYGSKKIRVNSLCPLLGGTGL